MFELLIRRFQSLSLIIFTAIGFVAGIIMQLILRTSSNRRMEGLIIAIITMILTLYPATIVLLGQTELKDNESKVYYIVGSFLFVLTVILGFTAW